MRVAVVQSFQQLVEVKPHIYICEPLKENLALYVWDVLVDQAGGLRAWISHDIVEAHNVGTPKEGLQYLDLSKYLFCADRLQNLDYAFLVVLYVAPFEYLRVLASAKLMHDLILVLITPRYFQRLIE